MSYTPGAKRRRQAAEPATVPAPAEPRAVPPNQAQPSMTEIIAAVTPAVTQGVVQTLITMGVIKPPTTDDVNPQQANASAVPSTQQQNTPAILPPPSTSQAIPLGLGIDSKVKAKIWADEYIEFSVLLSTHLHSDEVKFIERADGSCHFQKSPAASSITIELIRQWFEAFLIFTAIYCQRKPSASAATLNMAA